MLPTSLATIIAAMKNKMSAALRPVNRSIGKTRRCRDEIDSPPDSFWKDCLSFRRKSCTGYRVGTFSSFNNAWTDASVGSMVRSLLA